MANKRHRAQLNRGVKSWNQWRRDNPYIIPNFTEADLRHLDLSLADFREADLRGAKLNGTRLHSTNFRRANLIDADLSGTDLTFANFSDANLSRANLSRAVLREAYLRKALLAGAKLSRAILHEANLSFSNLEATDLSKADLTLAVIEAANLENADLDAAQALGANFARANLTGVCLKDWSINSKTDLRDAQCDYIYLQKNTNPRRFSSRIPQNGIFKPGEFCERFRKTSEKANFFFSNGIEELLSFLQAQQQSQTKKIFAIQSLESIEEVGLTICLEVLSATNQEAAKQFNEEQLQLVKAAYQLQANTQTQIIQLQKKHNADMFELAKIGASKSTDLHVGAISVSSSNEFTNNLQGANIGNFANNVSGNARQQAKQYNYSAEAKTLAEAAQEIQMLLDQLSQTYSTDTMRNKYAFAEEALRRIKDNTSLSQRVLSAIGAGSTSALEQFLDHPAASFVISAIEDWRNTRVE